MEWGKNWKLDLRYGRRTTPYSHYTGIAEGEVGELVQIYATDPAEPPGENPRGYDIQFTPFESESDDSESS
jgi:hypothetical protein